MILTTAAILFGLSVSTQAIPFPEASSVSSSMPDITAIMAVDPNSFPSYQTGGLVRANSTVAPSNSIAARGCAKGVSGDGNCCATSPILTWVSQECLYSGLYKLIISRETLTTVALVSN
jgi:hypothetical protein